MTDDQDQQSVEQDPEERTGATVPDDVAAASQQVAAESISGAAPRWTDKFVWQSLWKFVAVGFVTFFLIMMGWRAQTLLRQIGLALFFALAIIPGVNHLHQKRGWKRGAAVGAIYAGAVAFVVVMVVVLIPGIADFASKVGENGDDWVAQINDAAQDTIGQDLVSDGSGDEAVIETEEALTSWADNIVGAAASGIGLVFSLATIALFTFYFAADWPGIQRALLSRMPPHRQRRTAWILDTAIEETGGYFYSRMALMVINGGLFFVAMMLVGMPLVYALPLSIFEGFVAEFIPAVGTYIGAAVPILLTLAVQGFGAALILLVWVLIYQQAENYWLSPKISAQTMSINGGVAFGAALAGGAIAGPMGAFMALPVAALITSVVSNMGKTYAVEYDSKYAEADPPKTSNDNSGNDDADDA